MTNKSHVPPEEREKTNLPPVLSQGSGLWTVCMTRGPLAHITDSLENCPSLGLWFSGPCRGRVRTQPGPPLVGTWIAGSASSLPSVFPWKPAHEEQLSWPHLAQTLLERWLRRACFYPSCLDLETVGVAGAASHRTLSRTQTLAPDLGAGSPHPQMLGGLPIAFSRGTWGLQMKPTALSGFMPLG